MAGISTRADNYAQWYLDIVDKADLAEPSGVVRGAMVIKPTGYAVWEGIQCGLDLMLMRPRFRTISKQPFG